MASITGNGFEKNPQNISGGRPKGAKNIATQLRKFMVLKDKNGISNADKIWTSAIEKAIKGDVRAMEFIANRMEGHPVATIETKEIPPIEIIHIGPTTNGNLRPQLSDPGENSN